MPAHGVCILGEHPISARFAAFSHFGVGHLLNTFALLRQHNLYDPAMAMAFGGYLHEPVHHLGYLEFYLALFDSPPIIAPGCIHVPRSWTILSFPNANASHLPVATYEHQPTGNNHWFDNCHHIIEMRRLVAARRGARSRPARPLRIFQIVRSQREMANVDEVGASLFAFGRAHDAAYARANLEALAPLEQIDILLETDVLVGYHGSAMSEDPTGAHCSLPPICCCSLLLLLLGRCLAAGGLCWLPLLAAGSWPLPTAVD